MSVDPVERQPRRLMKTREVADLFEVEPPTVAEWARTGKLRAVRTPGGQQYRFRASDVEDLLSATEDSEHESGLARCVTTETSP